MNNQIDDFGTMTTDEEKFEWDDFYKDTRRLSLNARGAWIDCLYHMRISPTRGRISEPVSVYAIMFGSTIKQTQRVLTEIAERKVADCVLECNENVTLINRRMFREWQRQDADKVRQRRHRGSPDPFTEEECHASVTEMSQTTKKTPSYKKKEVIKKEDKEKNKKAISASRISDPFPLTEPMIEWASVHCPGLRLETAHESFIEYWTNNLTAKAKKVDWNLTWRKGMKLALRWQHEAEIRNGVGKDDPTIDTVSPPCDVCGKEICFSLHRDVR